MNVGELEAALAKIKDKSLEVEIGYELKDTYVTEPLIYVETIDTDWDDELESTKDGRVVLS